jgi:hypothetical protein
MKRLSTIAQFLTKVKGKGREIGSDVEEEGKEDRGAGERSKTGKRRRGIRGREEVREGIGREVGER